MILPYKYFKPLYMVAVIMRYKDSHYCLQRNINTAQKSSYGCSRNSCIDQYALEAISYVIAITAASAAQTAKIQAHL